MSYESFLAGKRRIVHPVGFSVPTLHERLFPFQRDIAAWALRLGRAAVFAGTGLGKTSMQVEWARRVEAHEDRPVLILAPLAVGQQTVAEARNLGVEVRFAREAAEVEARGVYVTNYERFERFDPARFAGVVLDESSILKAHDGKTRTALIEGWSGTRFRLACTATPAPNDFMELTNHAEFLGVMSRAEMLATFFVHDGGETQKWRLKGHAEAEFWKWMASWAVMLRSPADLGYDDDRYTLPPMVMREHVIESAPTDAGALFALEANTLHERRAARRASLDRRVKLAAELVAAEPDEPWLIWCDLNDESAALTRAIPGAVEVRGSDDPDEKERRLIGFSAGAPQVLVTKPSIAGFGMNWQHCARVVFVGLSDSWEAFYQAVRRCYRFGQEREVQVHVITSSAESAVLANIRRKERDADAMVAAMVAQMQLHSDVRGGRAGHDALATITMEIPRWVA